MDKIIQDNELWKEIPGYETTHQVSNYGRIKQVIKNTLLKNRLNSKGYHTINLTANGKTKTFKVHRLVALAFLPNPEKKEQVNHIDFNKLNNNFQNLEWVSNRENSCHSNSIKNKTSRYPGVCFRKTNNKWVSSIRFNGKSIHLGYFDEEDQAYQARKRFELENGISNKYS